MLEIREYKENEIQYIKELLISENIKDLEMSELIFIMIENEDILGVCKIEIENYIADLKYLVIKESKRNQKLGDGLLRGTLNKLDNQGIRNVYYKESNSYLIKSGFNLNENDQLELKLSEFFSGSCTCPEESNEVY